MTQNERDGQQSGCGELDQTSKAVVLIPPGRDGCQMDESDSFLH